MGRDRAVSALLFLALAACTGRSGSGSSSIPPLTIASPPAAGVAARNVITHVVVIVQENRTFDNLFGGYPGGPFGYLGADSAIPANIVALGMKPASFAIDPPYNARDWFRCLQVNSYDPSVWNDYAHGVWPTGPQPCPTSSPPENPDTTTVAEPNALTVVDDLHRVTYWNIANNYELGDNFYAIEGSDSFAAHQYIVALQSLNDLNEIIDGTPVRTNDSALSCGSGIPSNDVHTPALDLKSGFTNWHFEGMTGACWGGPTFGEHLDAAHVDWRHYTTNYVTLGSGGTVGGTFNGFINYRQWFAQTRGAVPGGRFRLSLGDLQNDIAGHSIGQFAWVKPPCVSLSDHPGKTHDPYGGQNWVASVINWIGSDPVLWPHTVIFVVWDDWGGFYDHAVPLQAPLDPTNALTPGMRQPFLVISAYGKGAGYVSHSAGTYASVLKFVEDLYGVKPLNGLDANAPDLGDYFNFSKTSDRFRPVTITESNFTPGGACAFFKDIPPYMIDR